MKFKAYIVTVPVSAKTTEDFILNNYSQDFMPTKIGTACAGRVAERGYAREAARFFVAGFRSSVSWLKALSQDPAAMALDLCTFEETWKEGVITADADADFARFSLQGEVPLQPKLSDPLHFTYVYIRSMIQWSAPPGNRHLTNIKEATL